MTDNTCKKRKGKKDRATAEATTRRNMKRRAAKEEKRQAADARYRRDRIILRKRGAVARLSRRIIAASSDVIRDKLTRSHALAVAAMKAAAS